MKKIYLLTTCLSLLLTFLCSTNLLSQKTTTPSAQAVVVGTVSNGNPVLTSLTNATLVLKGGLPSGASLTDVTIALNQESGKYVLIGLVVNGGISGKIVELELNGGVLRAAPGGPSVEVTCNGTNCAQCVPVVTRGGVHCVCKDTPLQTGAACDMTSKVVLSLW